MLKKILILLCFLSLTNCVSQSSAFLGPVITGARTGSLYQASLSYGSGKIINNIKKSELYKKSQITSFNDEKPNILLSYVIDTVIISDVIEPEPLP